MRYNKMKLNLAEIFLFGLKRLDSIFTKAVNRYYQLYVFLMYLKKIRSNSVKIKVVSFKIMNKAFGQKLYQKG